jgi:hypothetical protein
MLHFLVTGTQLQLNTHGNTKVCFAFIQSIQEFKGIKLYDRKEQQFGALMKKITSYNALFATL